MKRRTARGQKGKGVKRKARKSLFSPKTCTRIGPGGKERAQIGWIPAEIRGEYVVEEAVVVEASPVGLVRVASRGNSE